MAKLDPIPWWAARSWWKEPEYESFLGDSRQHAFAAIDTVKRYFDEAWWKTVMADGARHPVAAFLIGGGIIPLGFIISLGRNLQKLEKVDGFDAKLRELQGEVGDSALLEVEIAAEYAAEGWDVRFPRRGANRTPDVEARLETECVAIECKCLEREEWEYWIDELTWKALRSFNTLRPGSPILAQIDFNHRLSDIRVPEEKFPGLNFALAEAIVRKVEATVQAILQSDIALPAQHYIPGVATVRLIPHNENEHSSVGGCEISPVSQLRRILQNGLIRAAGQVPEEMPGIVVAKSDHMPDVALAEIAIDALGRKGPEEVKRVAALLILPQQYLGDHRSPILLRNPHCPRAAEGARAVSVLERVFMRNGS